jgi:hypothetical protein
MTAKRRRIEAEFDRAGLDHGSDVASREQSSQHQVDFQMRHLLRSKLALPRPSMPCRTRYSAGWIG